jgi:hypothetical protein
VQKADGKQNRAKRAKNNIFLMGFLLSLVTFDRFFACGLSADSAEA